MVRIPHEPPLLEGSRVRLRRISPRDRADRLALGRDPEFHRMVGGDPGRAARPLDAADVERWYGTTAADPLSWIMEAEEWLIGTARLHTVDPVNRRAAYAVGIFSASDRGKGYGEEATRLVLRWAFAELLLHRVEVRVLAFNARALRMYERCGFVREGIEREAARIGGRWEHDVRLSILAHEIGDLRPGTSDGPSDSRVP